MLPATVIAYDRAKNVASVQPQIYTVSTDGTVIKKAAVAAIPVLCLGGGGFLINFPLVAGSRGWIKANDRDISLYMQSGKMAAPNTQLLHDFSNAMFIPDVVNGYTLASEDDNNMVIQNFAGTVKIALWLDQIKITAPTLLVNCPQSTFDGSVTITGQCTISNIAFTEHKHTGVQAGSEDTGAPVT
jgi:hypothetical protein